MAMKKAITKKKVKKAKKKVGRKPPRPEPDPKPPRRKQPPDLRLIPWHRRKRRRKRQSPVTTILEPGRGPHYRIAVVGDGFTEAEQGIYNNRVDELLLLGVFANDVFWEDGHVFRVDRLNLNSNESPASTRTYDSDGNVTSEVIRDTALGYIYNGDWSHCWITQPAAAYIRLLEVLDLHTPGWQKAIVILNAAGFGGCAGGRVMRVTLAGGWAVTGHELGHGVGGLADEYCRPGDAGPGDEPTVVNITRNTNRATLKWNHFVDPATPIPTGTGACVNYTAGVPPVGWSNSDDAGLFEGGRYFSTGLYRPVVNCRMRGNNPPYCPICYTEIREILSEYVSRDFSKIGVGDFNGDGRDDLFLHTGRSLMIYRSDGAQLDPVFHGLYPLHEYWDVRPDDRFWIADFNGDGNDEVLLYNPSSLRWLVLLGDDGNNGLHALWAKDFRLSSWFFRHDDEIYISDFDGDGLADAVIVNRTYFGKPQVGFLNSTGGSFHLRRVYDGAFPDWTLSSADRFLVADIDGDGTDELIVFNGTDWSVPYLGVFKWEGSGLVQLSKAELDLGGWQMGFSDQFFVADFDGNGSRDLYVFNGTDWPQPRLGMLQSTGVGFQLLQAYQGNVPGWELASNDRFAVADMEGTGRQGLVVVNTEDWDLSYLGRLASNGAALTGTQITDPIGDWTLDSGDRLMPCNITGGVGEPNLIVQRAETLGVLTLHPAMNLLLHYHRWIHNYQFGRNP